MTAPLNIDEIEARLRANSPNGKPRIVIIGDEPGDGLAIFAGAVSGVAVGLLLLWQAGAFS